MTTGTRVSKSEFKEGELTEVKPEPGETQAQMLIRLLGGDNLPRSDEYETCTELLALLGSDEQVEIVAVTEEQVTARSGRVTKEYQFPAAGCTQNR